MDTAVVRKGHDAWAVRIEAELAAAVALVVVIGPQWPTVERNGRLR